MPTSAREPLLEVKDLSAGYGKIGVLKGVNLVVNPGEIVTLLGPNGAGKSTLLKSISGLLPWAGQIRFGGRDMAGLQPRDCVEAGLVHVVEGHRVFTQLTVEDNVLLAGYGMPSAQLWTQIEEALDCFPEIKAKRRDKAATLSGGQQQMLAVAQGLVRKPRLLMLDEPSAGLSPVLVDRVLAAASQLRESGSDTFGRTTHREVAGGCGSRVRYGGRNDRARGFLRRAGFATTSGADLLWPRGPLRAIVPDWIAHRFQVRFRAGIRLLRP